MNSTILNENHINALLEISIEAGNSILDIYSTNFQINSKEDSSPVTTADIASNKIITRGLNKITPHIPILSEESSLISYAERSKWNQYWLVDPLDGTKEFIKKNGEFTVNIALISNNKPIFGIVHAPVFSDIYWGHNSLGSYVKHKNQSHQKIMVQDRVKSPIRIATSRSHKSSNEINFLDNIKDSIEIPIGSSLKFCYLASGKADIYPRFGPTSEWDIAAGDAILRAAGGEVLDSNRNIFCYNVKKSIINGSFFAYGNKDLGKKFSALFYDSIT